VRLIYVMNNNTNKPQKKVVTLRLSSSCTREEAVVIVYNTRPAQTQTSMRLDRYVAAKLGIKVCRGKALVVGGNVEVDGVPLKLPAWQLLLNSEEHRITLNGETLPCGYVWAP
jgi:hypothetical protein